MGGAMSASPLRKVGDKYGRGSTPPRFSNSSHGLFADFAAMNKVDNNYCVQKKKIKTTLLLLHGILFYINYFYYNVLRGMWILIN